MCGPTDEAALALQTEGTRDKGLMSTCTGVVDREGERSTSFLLHCRVNTWLVELELEGLLLPDVVLGPLLHELIVLTLQLV